MLFEVKQAPAVNAWDKCRVKTDSGATLGQPWRFRALRLFLAVVCLGAYLGSNPLLHAAVHADSGSASHECLITLFSKEVIVPANAPVIRFVVVRPVLFTPLPARTPAASEDITSVGAPRAPPAFLLPQRVVG